MRNVVHESTVVGVGFAVLNAVLAGCATEVPTLGVTRAQLIGGEFDSDTDGVVALVSNGDVQCSGFLLRRNVVVTAAHCVGDDVPSAVVFGSNVLIDGRVVGVAARRRHPLFVPSNGETEPANDIAALLLETDAPADVEPLPVLPAAAADRLVPGAALRYVTFGGTTDGPGSGGTKRSASAALDSVGDDVLYARGDPARVCNGDSGGPGLITLDGVEFVAAIVAGGDPACAEYAVHTRVDTYMEEFLNHFPNPTAEFGERCSLDGNCRSGLCLAPLSSDAFAYCSTVCRGDDDCDLPTRCVRDTDGSRFCRHDIEPGVLGSACEESQECSSGECVLTADAAEKASACAIACVPQEEIACPPGFECRQLAAPREDHACLRPSISDAPVSDAGVYTGRVRPTGGCVVVRAASRERGALCFLAVLLLTVAIRRHRRWVADPRDRVTRLV